MTSGTLFARRRKWLLAGAALVLLVAAPALACAPQTKASVEPAQGVAGDSVTVLGTGFAAAGEPVSIYWGGSNGILLATATVDSSGNFAQQVTIPQAQPGNYWLQAVQADTIANFEFEIAGAGGATAPGGDSSATATSSDAAPGAAAALPQSVFEPAVTGMEPAAQPESASAPALASEPASEAPAASTEDTAAGEAPATTDPVAEEIADPVLTSEPDIAADAPASESAQPNTVPVPAPQEQPGVQPLPLTGDLGGPSTVDVGPSPWLLVPLVALGLGLVAFGGAVTANELRGRRTERVRVSDDE